MGATNVCLVALVLQSSSGGELSLHELSTGSLVEGEVTRHLGTHGSHITLTGSLLGSDLGLDVVEVLGETHAAVRSVSDNEAGLLDILGVDGNWLRLVLLAKVHPLREVWRA